MKSHLPYFAVLATALLLVLGSPSPSHGQAGSDDAALTALITDLTNQQTTIAENHAKIDEKIAVIAEDIRQARIMAKRSR
jgi:hypothetical protein